MNLALTPGFLALVSIGLTDASQDAPSKAAAPAPERAPERVRGAQPNARYELGWRVRQLERAWAASPGPEQRAKALPFIEAAVQHFFGFRFPDAAQAIDRATSSLTPLSDDPNWNLAWSVTPERRLVDGSASSLRFDARAFYAPSLPSRCSSRLDFALGESKAEFHAESLAAFAGSLELVGAPTGDLQLRVWGTDGDFANLEHSLTISIVEKRDERLAALEAAIAALPESAPRLERETAKALVALLRSLAAGSTEETDYPGARLLSEAEQVVAAAAKGERWYDSSKSGQFWLAVPTDPKRSTRVRVLVPPARADGAKPPLVVALHGAGGSENMFFDGYGDGEIVRQCESRGWMLVAPRLGFGGAPVSALVDELATRFAFDTERTFVVGHSMGAGVGTSVVLAEPARYRAFAALGGGQALKAAADLKALPVFVGAGERDFGLPGAKKLHESLVAAGAERAIWRVYPNTEHLMIVQDALPDVFALFGELAGVEGGSIEPLEPQRPIR